MNTKALVVPHEDCLTGMTVQAEEPLHSCIRPLGLVVLNFTDIILVGNQLRLSIFDHNKYLMSSASEMKEVSFSSSSRAKSSLSAAAAHSEDSPL